MLAKAVKMMLQLMAIVMIAAADGENNDSDGLLVVTVNV